MGVEDSPELCLEDWIRFGELAPEERWPRAWAECYVNESREWVYDWVRAQGLKFMPAGIVVERGERIKGNSVPRYHILWGTGRELVQVLIAKLQGHRNRGRLTLLHEHRATSLTRGDVGVTGCRGVCTATGEAFRVAAERTIIATGGINGSVEKVREHWLEGWPGPPDVVFWM